LSTFTIAADKLGNVSRAAYSSWNIGDAIQGTWTGGYPRVGAMLFSKLRDSVDWADQEITAIRLTLQFPKAGGSDEKTLYLYQGTQTELTGTGTAMLGTAIGNVPTNGSAYNSTRTIYFSPDSNAAAFANLVSWLQSGTSTTLAVYVNESATAYGWSENALYIRAATLSVDHDVKGSRGTLDRTGILAGETVSLTIAPLESDGTVTHKVQWKMGSAQSSVTTLSASTLTASYTVPKTWLNQIPNDVSGTAYCVLTTLVDGVQTAQRQIPFTVSAGADVVPAFSVYSSPVGTGTKYYQFVGGAAIVMYEAEPGQGATLKSYRIRGTEGVDVSGTLSSTSTGAQVNIGKLKEAGLHTYDVTVTDSRGRSLTLTWSFSVTAVAPPKINNFLVQRYSQRVDDSGATVYEASTDGNRVWVTLDAQIDTAGGYNSPTLKLGRTPEDGTETITTIAWGSGATCVKTNDRTLITAQIPLDSGYGFTLYLTDTAGREVTASSSVTNSRAIMHYAGNGNGVAVGMYSTGTSARPMFESAWEAAFYGGIEGVTNYKAAETPTGGTWIDGNPIYRQVISFGAIAAGEEKAFWFSTPNRGVVVSLRGMAVLGDYPMPLPHVEEVANRCVKCLLNTAVNQTAVIIGCGSGMRCDSGFVIVEYTKTE